MISQHLEDGLPADQALLYQIPDKHSFNNKVAREFRPFLLAITSQHFLTKLVSQLGHFAPESFAQGSCEVGARPLVVLTLSWE